MSQAETHPPAAGGAGRPEESATEMGKHRAAIVGCGRMGTEHGRAYAARPDADLVAIADPDPENLAAFGDRFGVPGRALRRLP